MFHGQNFCGLRSTMYLLAILTSVKAFHNAKGVSKSYVKKQRQTQPISACTQTIELCLSLLQPTCHYKRNVQSLSIVYRQQVTSFVECHSFACSRSPLWSSLSSPTLIII